MLPAGALANEWLESDGLGGFASGTVGLTRTRRYHALLLTATQPPARRAALVNGFDAWIETTGGRHAISSQRYADESVGPDGATRIASFDHFPWPRWTFRLGDGTLVEHELVALHGEPIVCLTWRTAAVAASVRLTVRPFLSGRDFHALHHENAGFRFDASVVDDRVAWQGYSAWPAVAATSNGAYVHEPYWYRSFLYTEDRARGLDYTEDLASPGVFHFEIQAREAVLVLGTEEALERFGKRRDAFALAHDIRSREKRRRSGFVSRLRLAGDAYVVKRGDGLTILAGYPWFGDWGRDTFIAMRGLLLATGRFDAARAVLSEWAGTVSLGMLPNRFQDSGDQPEYNSVDAALWFVVAVHELLAANTKSTTAVPVKEVERLVAAVLAILEGYSRGTRHGICMDADGLLRAGEPGVQLTWMDAKVGAHVVTPRMGKPVEVQALWLNALQIGAVFEPKWAKVLTHGRASFQERFWNDAKRSLHDVVDDNGTPGCVDSRFRPNQIFAVGGLPFPVLDGERARAVVDGVEARLLTPLGLRTLARDEPGYAPHYEGGEAERDAAYHQGTVWPWLLGPFVEAWVRTHGGSADAKREARERFLQPLMRHLNEAGLGHVSEIADGDAPHPPRGCPFQAWSVGETLRLDLAVLAETN